MDKHTNTQVDQQTDAQTLNNMPQSFKPGTNDDENDDSGALQIG